LFGGEAEGDVENEEVEKVAIVEYVSKWRGSVQFAVPEDASY
jgi:hypothetical protein